MDARYRLVSRDSAAPRRNPADDGSAPGSPWGQWREPGSYAAYGSAGRSGGWFGGGRGFWNWPGGRTGGARNAGTECSPQSEAQRHGTELGLRHSPSLHGLNAR